MSNTIEYGQASVNNTIGFGKGAIDNNISWGDDHGNSWSPETNLTGGTSITKRSYNNEFFGFGTTPILSALNDTDYLSGATEFTTSFWLDVITSFASWNNFVVPMSKVVAGRGGTDFLIGFGNTINGTLEVRIFVNETIVFKNSSLSTNINNWNHILFRFDSTKGSTYISELYINDVSITNESITGGVSFQSASKVFGIGAETSTGVSEEMDITKVGLWNRTLSLAEKTAIYNNGCPTDLSAYSPNTYLKIDDYTTNNGELQFPNSGSTPGTWESLADETDGISTNVPCP